MSKQKKYPQNEEEARSLMEDLAWLENEYPTINERAIQADSKRRAVETKLEEYGLIGLVR